MIDDHKARGSQYEMPSMDIAEPAAIKIQKAYRAFSEKRNESSQIDRSASSMIQNDHSLDES